MKYRNPCADAPLSAPNRGHLEARYVLKDARGIPCGYVCAKCESWKRGLYRAEIFENPNYWHDEEL